MQHSAIYRHLVVLSFGLALLTPAAPALAVSATGGDSTNDSGVYRIHTFTNSGVFTVTEAGPVDVVVVGGGGGGGADGTTWDYGAGGGGAGGYQYISATNLTPQAYAVTVGAGGAGAPYPRNGSPGSNSVFSTIIAYGGGYGAGGECDNINHAGGRGGCGGGGKAGNPADGYWGGRGSGIQGGYGYVGDYAVTYTGGGGGGASGDAANYNGAAGLTNPITGIVLGGGGGGGDGGWGAGVGGAGGGGNGGSGYTYGKNGTNGFGGGGGGGYLTGGTGGCGIVIVRYHIGPPPLVENRTVTNLTSTSAWMNACLLSTGGAPVTVKVYWGDADYGDPTNDTWQHTNTLAGSSWTNNSWLTWQATNLTPNGVYYYRFYATNSLGQAWASSSKAFSTDLIWVSGRGGDIGTNDGYRYHVFNNSGTFEALSTGLVEVLVVGGGGGGGSTGGGGGGGGGVVYTSAYTVAAGYYTVTIGAGGKGGFGWGYFDNDHNSQAGMNGENSSFAEIIAVGGGRGCGYEGFNSSSVGGSGGGGNVAGSNTNDPSDGIAGQGNAGGAGVSAAGGGGGGAGSPGTNGITYYGGQGGAGREYFGQYFGGGGGGGAYTGSVVAAGGVGGGGAGSTNISKAGDGTPNTGGGGGGAGNWFAGGPDNAGIRYGGAGGSGIVIVRYALPRLTVENLAPTNVNSTSAWLNASLVCTGLDTVATVSVYWGTTDGGAPTSGTWEATNNVAGDSTTWTNGASLTCQVTGLTPNAAYYYRFYATNTSGGQAWAPISERFVAAVKPSITAQPQSLTNNPGQEATFSVQASGDATLCYQWQKDATNIAGATATNYTIAAAAQSNEGSYRCVVTNLAGAATSEVATLTVNDPPVITGEPQSLTNNPGQAASFGVQATGTAPLGYQWQKNNVNIDGATATNYTIGTVAKLNEGGYRCIVTNMAGSATSAVASLTVNDPPVITGEPQSLTNNPGQAASFGVQAGGTAPLYYQWQKDGTNIAGATATNYAIASAAQSDEGGYRCLVSNMVGAVTSAAATLTVNDPPAITGDPQSLTRDPGQTAAFSVQAGGTAPLAYRWQKDGADLAGATAATYTIASVATNDAGGYRCIVTNTAGAVTSAVATLTVNAPPAPSLDAPTGVAASDGTYADKVRVTWNSVAGATSYLVYRSLTNSSASASQVGSSTAAAYDDTAATNWPETALYYWVKAANALTTSVFSASAQGACARDLTVRQPLSCDLDGDLRNDLVLYQESSGIWAAKLSASGYAAASVTLGGPGYQPIPKDFDGDRKADPAIYDSATGDWAVMLSGSGYGIVRLLAFGGAGCAPLAGDFDGDLKADPGIYAAGDGTLLVKLSGSGYGAAAVTGFGGGGYTSMALDFDGDGKADPAIYQTASGNWTVMLSGSGYAQAAVTGFGGPGYLLVSGMFDSDARADAAIYNPANGNWTVLLSASAYITGTLWGFGAAGDVPVVGDFDGDGKADPALYQGSTSTWFVKPSGSGYATVSVQQ